MDRSLQKIPLIGIFGGTFDPVHSGHVQLAAEACAVMDFERIRFVPLGQAVHRTQPQATVTQRKIMLQLALADEPCLVLDTRELRHQRPSYMVDTLGDCRAEMPHVALCMILGSDAFAVFDQWREPERILSLCHLLVLQRPGYTSPWSVGMQALMSGRVTDDAQQLHQQKAGQVYFLTTRLLGISSTSVRACVQSGQCPEGLLNERVAKYITSQTLYIDD